MKRCVCSRCVFSRAVSELARLTLNGGRLERMHETREKRLETTRGWGWGRRARENSGRPRARQPSEVGKNPPSPTTADTGERGGEGRAAHRHPECAPLEDGMRKDSLTLRAQPSTTNSPCRSHARSGDTAGPTAPCPSSNLESPACILVLRLQLPPQGPRMTTLRAFRRGKETYAGVRCLRVCHPLVQGRTVRVRVRGRLRTCAGASLYRFVR